MMNILVTGARGFVGKNLCAALKNIAEGKDRSFPLSPDLHVLEYDVQTDPALLDGYCKDADFVFHLAGVNRPKEQEEFMEGNFGFTSTLLELLQKHRNTCPVMLSSSIQAELDNPYGQSKKAGEDLLFRYAERTGAKVLIYRFPNLFGKWCRPNYNSAVATFCHNIAHGLPIQVNDPSHQMTLVYIDDVVSEFIHALCGQETRDGKFCRVEPEHHATLGEIADQIRAFQQYPQTLGVPDLTQDSLVKKLYSTYLSYLPESCFAYKLKMNKDERGSFTEILRTAASGQFSVNISKPGITKGNHWHNTKNEKFVVVHGRGLIQLRRIGTDENGQPYPVVNYEVCGEEITVVEMIPGYTHNIVNLSDTEELVTFMWANEAFDPEKPDTFFEVVE